MKKRWMGALLALVLTLSALGAPGFAAGTFPDVTDEDTAREIEVLRLLGVLDGASDGKFYPEKSLSRAEFCKMAVELVGRGAEIGRYQTRTIFPDVRATHWALGYVNFAASELKIIKGQSDGKFAPDRSITYGEAVTILLRIMGYGDGDAGAVWPDGYVNLAAEKGLAAGVSADGRGAITRAQAAKLFVNVLTAETKAGAVFLETRGGTIGKSETTLTAVDMTAGTVKTADNADGYAMAHAKDCSAFIGLKGRVVLDAKGKLLTFLPTVSSAGSAVADGVILVAADGSAAGFDAITGGAKDYKIVKNGVEIARSALRKYDVATFRAAENTVYVCDTRVAVFYENCAPSPAAAETVTVLGGTVIPVLKEAQQSLARFKPGMGMTILLSAEGGVAGAVANNTAGAGANARGVVNTKGEVTLLGGDRPLPLKLSGSWPTRAGWIVSVSQSTRDTVALVRQSGVTVNGDLDLNARTLGTTALAERVTVYVDGELASFDAINRSVVPKSEITFAGKNEGGAIGMIAILNPTGSEYYGRFTFEGSYDPAAGTYDYAYALETGPDETLSYYDYGAAGRKFQGVKSGDFVSLTYSPSIPELAFMNVTALEKVEDVPASAWVGKTAVNVNGQTCTVASDVPCYNADSGAWMDGLDAARAYSDTVTLYIKDGAVRILEVGG